MITDEELKLKIDQVCENYIGQLDDLYTVVGMIVVGRRYGWRVIRLVSARRHWMVAKTLFGDPKQLMREKEYCYHKSFGCQLIDKAGEYWEYVKGHRFLPLDERRGIK